ncbi:alpha/beta fold hydrolase [Tsukamurella sp. 1534]|uniref:S9 family peptidase n=1 Tax=Tsukamurella sp. 1534 TaxID=1151061 RepID=UPI0006ACDE2D|nr:alpha/beta fold hydrolase [Tsukamurella sp. 1534]
MQADNAVRPRRIEIEEFFADPAFSGAVISPDGTRLAYLAPAYGRTQVWVRGVDDEHTAAICVTRDERRGIKTFYWTDDPRWLIYRQDTDGNEDWHLYRVDLEAPETPAVDLTPMAPGSRVLQMDVMRTKPGHILVEMNPDPMVIGLYTIEVATGQWTLVREQRPDGDGGGAFGWETQERFYSRQDAEGNYEIFAIDESDERRLLLRLNGIEYPIGPNPMFPAPDGDALVLGLYQDGTDEMRLVRQAHDGTQSVVAALPGHSLCVMGFATEDFGFPPSVFFSRRTGEPIAARFVGDRPIIVPVDPHFAEVLDRLSTLSDGVIDTVSSDTSEQRWVVSFLNDRDPGATYFYDHSTGESRLLFRAHPQLAPPDLAPMTAVSFVARDGLPLHAFLTLPVGVEPHGLPLVLLVHGGPWANDMWGYNREVQMLANRGYAVLQVNFRGSTGYGRTHLTAAVGELAGAMHDDLIDAAEWTVAQGFAARDRIGIYGGSYGGYAALVGATFTPDYFAAAVDYVGVASLIDYIEALPPFVRPHLRNNWLAYAGDPEVAAEAEDMRARSPITFVDRIRTPLLVVQGANDVRVRRAESDAIVTSLRDRGVPVEYFVADDEGHDFQNPENLVTMFRLIEQHLGRHLGEQ